MDSSETPESVAVEQLEQFGLSTYAARTFVALVGLDTGTAREISRVSTVPRTRVYDAIDELQDRGLVDVQQASPKQFWAVSAETASRTFTREMERRTAALRTALTELETTDDRSEQRGVWTVDGQSRITDRVVEFFESADEEILFMTAEPLLSDTLLDSLAAAAHGGVSVTLAGVSPAVADRVQEAVPDVRTVDSVWDWSDTAAGRLVMVDRDTTLVSVLLDGHDIDTTPSETAIWGDGDHNSLVVVLTTIFTAHLDAMNDGRE